MSQSAIWTLNRQYYQRLGPEAWLVDELPSYPTTNAFVARAMADVIGEFLGEASTAGRHATILELGGSNGAMAWRLGDALDALAERLPLPEWRYVMTDVSERNLELVAQHPRHRPRIETGQLRVERLDLTDPALGGDSLADVFGSPGPLVVFGGYVLDSVPSDAYVLEDGTLRELLVSVSGDADGRPQDLEVSFSEGPAVLPGRYAEPVLDEQLEWYTANLGNTVFLLPTAGLRFVMRVAERHPGPILMLFVDKGYGHAVEMCGLGDPAWAGHGSVSSMVNLHALGRAVRRAGGLAMHTAPRDVGDEEAALACAAFVLNQPVAPRTAQRFARSVDAFGPSDYADLHAGGAFDVADPEAPRQLARMLALLRLAAWDPMVFLRMGPAFVTAVGGLDREESRPVREALANVEAGFYPFDPAKDVHFAVGVTYHAMGCWPEALTAFHRSEAAFGPSVDALHNRALCRWALGEAAAAAADFERALAVDPDYAPAREGRLRVEAELRRS